MTLQIGSSRRTSKPTPPRGGSVFTSGSDRRGAYLFSHPKDFTPVCTTELGQMARLKPEFDRRGTKVIGLSVDPVAKHIQWSHDIEETQGAAAVHPVRAAARAGVEVSSWLRIFGVGAPKDLRNRRNRQSVWDSLSLSHAIPVDRDPSSNDALCRSNRGDWAVDRSALQRT